LRLVVDSLFQARGELKHTWRKRRKEININHGLSLVFTDFYWPPSAELFYTGLIRMWINSHAQII
jgi:hypothetical protein